MITYDKEVITHDHPELDVIILDTVDSTNTYAKTIPAEHNTLILAYQQTAGYGRFKRAWESSPRSDIMMTLLLVDPAAAPGAMVSLYAGYELVKAMETFIDRPVMIKYPNDVYLDGKKCAGILVEHIYSGPKLERTVIGIGVNVYGDTSALRAQGIEASSLAQAGFTGDVNGLINRFLTGFFSEQSSIADDAPLFLEKLARYHLLYDTDARVTADGESFACTVKGISPRGGLMLYRGGSTREYNDVSIERFTPSQ